MSPPAVAPPPPTSGVYRSPGSGGYVRSKSEVSPERRQEWKRQRNEIGHPRRLSETSLTNAIETSLTLKDRVGGSPALPVTSDAETSKLDRRPGSELISPSSVLQSRSRRSFERTTQQKDDESGVTTAPSESITSSSSAGTDNDISKLSGLAALASAAFAKLDEKS